MKLSSSIPDNGYARSTIFTVSTWLELTCRRLFQLNVQMVGWVKMPLGMEVGLGPGDIMLDGDPAPPMEKGTTAPPLFGPCLLWPNGRPSQQLLSSYNSNISLNQCFICRCVLYCCNTNSLLYGTSGCNISKLHRTRNSLSRTVYSAFELTRFNGFIGFIGCL